ncbi:probable LRR receptor-like serine/threonine-protein kinase At1g06840 [Quercus lobata]|uniref:probable LRR receptor-like serine/threonine-protein kinase At1g06840 n=1 Tax=Quercus lobata TaxID=97700 RepID=UPI0012443C99|nr:probable LRR receptor-like serine/threonine-protein kinase At1g06840 [Quercus lobata]
MYQSKAWTFGLFIVAWLCHSLLLIGAQNPITNPEEVRALRAIKSSLIDPNGNLSNWDQGDPCTSIWTAVFCYNTTLDDGYLHVQRLVILHMNLSGTLSPELGRLLNLKILDFMWNNISGSIPKEIGSITSLELLLLNGNQLTGPLPEELGYLPNMDRIQIDQNQISGPLPKSFANLNKTKHFHMNNNSISGQIPPELSRLPSLVHLLLDNNNLSGYLPEEFFKLPNLRILYGFLMKLSASLYWASIKMFVLIVLTNVTDGANSPSSGLSKGALAGLVLGTIAGAVTLSAVVILLIMRMHVGNYHSLPRRHHLSTRSIKIVGLKDFTYREMAVATNNFEKSTQIGEGGYGKVYKGILADGTVVAIKRAQEGSLQGVKEFLTEIEFLSRLHHQNLVSLIGYCDEEGEQMLVYEFMSNGTLRDHLFAKCKEPLSFTMRLRIALGLAKGILYLHTEANPSIFHRDIKASNILLDSKYMAKVADFGLSQLALVPDIEGTVPAHVSTVVKGTPGYLDPEYILTRKLTDKSDVYSLGVVFLELLTGKQPISHGKNIVREVNVECKSGMIFSVIDGRMGSYPPECVVKFLNLALKCCEDETDARPSMAEVDRELESIWHLMSDSYIRSAGPMVTNAEKDATPLSSSSIVKDSYVSSEISAIELVSGVIPSTTL